MHYALTRRGFVLSSAVALATAGTAGIVRLAKQARDAAKRTADL